MNISVIGSGTMGNGIAHVFAQAGYSVKLIDISQQALDKAILTITANLERQATKGIIKPEVKDAALKNISISTSIPEGVKDAGLVIEAATENLELKLNIFRELDKSCKPDTILASNTSSISITQIAAVTKRSDKVIGMHFMNP